MTVTLSKRLFEDASSSLTSPPASKKLRGLVPLTEHVPNNCHVKPGVTALGSLQHHSSTARKRRHDGAGPDASSNGAVSPSASGKRGKRADGRPSTAAASPSTAKSALEALLTCEGLEKDPDVEAEVAYITSRQQPAASTATAGGTSAQGTGARPSAGNRHAGHGVLAGQPNSTVLDAARSSREKRRDQDQGGRAHRPASRSGNSSNRDQVDAARAEPAGDAPTDTSATPAAPAGQAAAAAAPAPGARDSGDGAESPKHITLDLVTDKEWQRLFAVLSISEAPPRSSNAGGLATPTAAAAAAATPAAQPVSAAATAAGGVLPMQEAPSTPARREDSCSGCGVVMPSRSGFLTGEFHRVQQRHRSTPPQHPPGAAAVADAPAVVNGHVPYMCFDADMHT